MEPELPQASTSVNPNVRTVCRFLDKIRMSCKGPAIHAIFPRMGDNSRLPGALVCRSRSGHASQTRSLPRSELEQERLALKVNQRAIGATDSATWTAGLAG